MRDVQDGRRDSSVGELIEATWPVVLPLIGIGILSGIAIGIGFLLMRILVNVAASTLSAPIAALAAATIYYRLLALDGGSAPSPEPPVPPSPAGPAAV